MPEQQELSHINLPTNVSDAMRENLPQMMNKMLREELGKGQVAVDDLEQLKKDFRVLEDRKETAAKLKAEKRRLGTVEDGLNVREYDISKREREAALDLLKVKLEAEERFSGKLAEITMGLVRNTNYRDSIFHNHTGSMGFDAQGNQIPLVNSTNTDKTAD